MAFQQLKTLLIRAPVLTYPDSSRQYILDTNGSKEAASAVLSQMVEDEERVVAYYSKMFSPPQQNYCDQEGTIGVSDGNQPLPAILLRTGISATYGPCISVLSVQTDGTLTPSSQVEFQYQLKHRPGAKHGNADRLSRCADCPQLP